MVDCLSELRARSPQFVTFIQTQEQRPECAGQLLDSLLITPIQRLPRYELLLRELVECTPEEHPDSAELQAAFDAMRRVNHAINESRRDAESLAETRRVANSIRSKTSLAEAHRRLLRQGTVNISTGEDDLPQVRTGFCF